MEYTLDTLAAEQEELLLSRFDYEYAWKLGMTLRSHAQDRKAPVAIEVTHGLTPVFTSLLPGATEDNLAWAARKRNVVHRFQRSSLAIRLEAEKGGYNFNQGFCLPASDYIASGGGLPLILRGGTLIGTVAVSGLPDVEDHCLAVEVLRLLL